jgi:hypothetical protein
MRLQGGSRKSSGFFAGLIGLAAVGILGFGARPALAQVPITSGISFQQDDFAFDNSTGDPTAGQDESNTGQVSADITSLQSATGLSSGYLNVVNSTGWAVQNMPVNQNLPDNASAFNLGTSDGTTDSSTSEAVYFTAAPLTTAPADTESSFGVTQQAYDAEGVGEDGVSGDNDSDIGKPASAPASGGITFNIAGLTKNSFTIGMPNVQAADNQCGPAAMANALTYLKSLNSVIAVPDPNVPGRGAFAGSLVNPNQPNGATYAANTVLKLANPNTGNSSAQTDFWNNQPTVYPFALPYGNYTTSETAGASLVGQMDLLMGRVTQNRAQYFKQFSVGGGKFSILDANPGVSATNILKGAEQYTVTNADTNLVKFNYQNFTGAAGGFQVNDPGVAGIGAPTDQSAQGFNYLVTQLGLGNAVEVNYGSPGRGGHATDAVAAGYILGVPYIVLQSDLNQTDTDNSDTSVSSNGIFGKNGLQFSFLSTNMAGAYVLGGIAGAPILADDIIMTPVPEPATICLLVGAVPALMMRRRRKSA